jgi:hypothetical protein
MRKIGKRTTTTLFAVLVAGGLSFGVTSAFAGPAGLDDCPIEPPDFLGRCPAGGVQECVRKCQFYGATTGDCPQPSNCCICFSSQP